MKVEVLYFDGCPTYETATKTLRAVLAEEGSEAEVQLVAVNSDEEAGRLRFLKKSTILHLLLADRTRAMVSQRGNPTSASGVLGTSPAACSRKLAVLWCSVTAWYPVTTVQLSLGQSSMHGGAGRDRAR
jgi:hypothetical protein